MYLTENGWQSIDGIERKSYLYSCIKRNKKSIQRRTRSFSWNRKEYVQSRVCITHGQISTIKGRAGRPHLHNGCFYSGVFFIHADGDESILEQ